MSEYIIKNTFMTGFVVQGHIFALKLLQNQHKWVPTAD